MYYTMQSGQIGLHFFMKIGHIGRFIEKSTKKNILEKRHVFLDRKSFLEVLGLVRQGKPLQSQVRMKIPYIPTKSIFRFVNIEFYAHFSKEKVKEDIRKNFMFSNRKINFVGL